MDIRVVVDLLYSAGDNVECDSYKGYRAWVWWYT